MPVMHLRCPDCGHEFRSLVMDGTKVPTVWTCSVCHGRRSEPHRIDETSNHPMAGGTSCPCCG